jgi:polysaccharide export outer membrane protein
MKRFLLPVLCALSVLPTLSHAAEKSAAYLLNPGDAISISVWGEDKLKQELKVLSGGTISPLLTGPIDVKGLDTTAVEKLYAKALLKYYPEPIVSVSVTGTEGNRVFVQGKVMKPGEVHLNGPTSVLQVLSVSGGLDKFADKGGIMVLRGDAPNQKILPVDYNALMSGKDLSTNYPLQAGDTLVVN